MRAAANFLVCPHCGEAIDNYVDPGGGARQEYIDDCSVCCRPIRFRVVQIPDTGEYVVDVSSDV